MSLFGPRILLIGRTYRALCLLERLIERGERVVAFVGQEGSGERDFCPEILEICDRHQIPARAARKLGEETVRWLEDRIRPDLAIAVGVDLEIPLAIGGNTRFGLIEASDLMSDRDCPGVVLRERGKTTQVRVLEPPPDRDSEDDAYLVVIDEMLAAVDECLDALPQPERTSQACVAWDDAPIDREILEEATREPDPGAETGLLEREVAEYLGADRVIALGSTAAAFALLAEALDLGEDADVVFPGVCARAPVVAVQTRGARAVFADVEPHTLTLDAERVADLAGPRTRALLIAHPFGQPAALDQLYPLAERLGLEVIEDGGCGLGARFEGSPIGRSPCTTVFRLPLVGSDAHCDAALLTLPGGLFERIAPHAKTLRLGNGAARSARRLLAKWEKLAARRLETASRYSTELRRYDAFRVPVTPKDRMPVHSAYALHLTRFSRTTAEDLHKLLGESGVETRRLWIPALERQLAELPCTDQARIRTLLLPTHAGLTRPQADQILDLVFDYTIG